MKARFIRIELDNGNIYNIPLEVWELIVEKDETIKEQQNINNGLVSDLEIMLSNFKKSFKPSEN